MTEETPEHPPAGRARHPGAAAPAHSKGDRVKTFRKFMVGLSSGVVVWAGTAFIPVVGHWAPVFGLVVALVLWL
jgi:hypothetical protein